MEKKHLPLICLCLILMAICGALCGCTNDGTGSNDPGFIYLPEYIALPEDIQYLEQACLTDDTIYFSSYSKIGEREPAAGEPQPGDESYYEGYYDIYGPALYEINIDGSGFTQLSEYVPPAIPEGQEGSGSLNGLAVDAEGYIWVAESYSFYHFDDLDQWVDDGIKNYLRKLDSNGAELASFDISALFQENAYFYINQILPANDGYLYTTDGNTTAYALDSNGNLVFKLSVDNWINQLILLSDGSVAATAYEGNGMVMKKIDSAAQAWGDSIEIATNFNQVYSGTGEYDFYYTDSANFYGYNLNRKTADTLINWIGSDIDGTSINRVMPMEDGRILCLMYNYSNTDEGGQELALLTKHDSSEIAKKTNLTMAALYLDSNIRAAIIKFNKTNSDYRIILNDYSIYSTEEDYQAGIKKLNTEIISGQIPDIIAVNGLPIKQYAAKGLLEDLYPYIDNDTKLGGRDAFIGSVFSAMEVGDILPYIAANFSVITALGNSQVVGSEPGWTIDELNAALATMPEGCRPFPYMDRQGILYYLCAVGMDQYVDWASGECHFDSPGFIKLLGFAQAFPEMIDWEDPEYMKSELEMIQNGEIMLMQLYLGDFQEFQRYKSMFGGEVTFKGYPSENSIGSVFTIDNGLAMSSKCKHKDAVWQFIRYLLTNEYQTDNYWYGFPTNKNVFDARLTEAMSTKNDENSDAELYKERSYPVEYPVDMYSPLTQEEADQILSLINKVENTMSYDTAIMDIITEEAAAFFAGSKSAADTAAVIQSRVGIYVSEQI